MPVSSFNFEAAKNHQHAFESLSGPELAHYLDKKLKEENPFHGWIMLAEQHKYKSREILNGLEEKYGHFHLVVKLAERFYDSQTQQDALYEIQRLFPSINDIEHPFVNWLTTCQNKKSEQTNVDQVKESLHEANYLAQLIQAILQADKEKFAVLIQSDNFELIQYYTFEGSWNLKTGSRVLHARSKEAWYPLTVAMPILTDHFYSITSLITQHATPEIRELFYEKFQQVKYTNYYNMTFHTNLYFSNNKNRQTFQQALAEQNITIQNNFFNSTNIDQDLFKAVKSGDPTKVEACLELGTDADFIDPLSGNTVYEQAIECYQQEQQNLPLNLVQFQDGEKYNTKKHYINYVSLSPYKQIINLITQAKPENRFNAAPHVSKKFLQTNINNNNFNALATILQQYLSANKSFNDFQNEIIEASTKFIENSADSISIINYLIQRNQGALLALLLKIYEVKQLETADFPAASSFEKIYAACLHTAIKMEKFDCIMWLTYYHSNHTNPQGLAYLYSVLKENQNISSLLAAFKTADSNYSQPMQSAWVDLTKFCLEHSLAENFFAIIEVYLTNEMEQSNKLLAVNSALKPKDSSNDDLKQQQPRYEFLIQLFQMISNNDLKAIQQALIHQENKQFLDYVFDDKAIGLDEVIEKNIKAFLEKGLSKFASGDIQKLFSKQFKNLNLANSNTTSIRAKSSSLSKPEFGVFSIEGES